MCQDHPMGGPGDVLGRSWIDEVAEPLLLLEAVRDESDTVVDFVRRDFTRAAHENLGLTRAELLNTSVTAVGNHFYSQSMLAKLAECLDSGEPVVFDEVTYYTVAYSLYLEVHAVPIGGDFVVMWWRDMSDRVEAMRKLAAQELKNRELAQRLAAELSSAAHYVTSVLPSGLSGKVEAVSRYLPAATLGGDSFDYRWLDDDHLLVYIIDVSGHGIRPALLSMSVHNLIRSGSLPASVLIHPDLTLGKLNSLFRMEEQGDSYFTVWYGVYQPSTRTLRYAGAGHPPALALDHSNTVSRLSSRSAPVGLFDDTSYRCSSYTVPAGGQLLLYSDGAFDLTSESVHESPISLEDFIAACATLAADPAWTLDSLVACLKERSPDGRFHDDCSLVLLTFP